MKQHLSNLKDKLAPYAEHTVAVAKRVWSGYGYYISLACLLALFGTAAYLYKTDDHDEYLIGMPTATNSIAVLANISATAEPTPAPTPYAPAFVAPVNGDVIAEYSPDDLIWNDTLGQWRVHNGVDVAATAGTAVCASERGVISGAYTDEIYGNTIEITHEDGWVTRYCSLETLSLVEIGMTVAKGDVISSVGSSAIAESSSEPHVHFEILRNGQHVPPEY